MIRFQADADLKTSIREGLIRRHSGIDFQVASGVLADGLPDDQVLAVAAGEGRILVSHDRKTMPCHFLDFIQVRTSPGLILIPQSLPVRRAVEDLLLLWEVSMENEWQNQILYLPLQP
jgi:hypothetical protein